MNFKKICLRIVAVITAGAAMLAHASPVPLKEVSGASLQPASSPAQVALAAAPEAASATPETTLKRAQIFTPGEYEGNLAQRIADNLKAESAKLLERAQQTVSDWQQQGVASWYGPGFHGRLTASGERFNTQALTAAHLNLPFGTLLRVRSEQNGREVIVRVNDRGPYAKGRIIDLSQAAARALGIQGLGRVIIERLEGDNKPKR